ncbi:MAG: ABC transporter permease [Peptococcaceae bacterium]|nr:ABC transporter permease [Peptococcaceae bacterium]
MYLLKKMFKDFWAFKNQFMAVFMMALIGVIIYSGMEGVWMGMQDYADKWFEESNGADAWISGINLDEDDIKKIKSLPDVSEIQASTVLTAKVANAEAYVLLTASSSNSISRPFISQGMAYRANADGIWLYEDFAEAHNLTVGQSITVENKGIPHIFKIQGLVLSPEYLSYTGSSASIKPDRFKYGYGYISPDNMKKITEPDVLYNQAKLKIGGMSKDPDTIRHLRTDIERVLGPKYAGFATVSEFKGTSAYIDKYVQVRIMSILFSIIFILLAMLTMQTTMKRLVETQRIQIGTLKALGYSNNSLLDHYGLYGFWSSVMGSLAGYFLAPYVITNMLLEIQKDLFSLPEWTGKNTAISLLVAAAIVLGCSLSARRACKKVIKEMPAKTMRGEQPKDHKPIFLERFKIWQSLSYDWQWILRDFSRNKIRFTIGVIGIIGSITLLMASFGLKDSLTHANDRLFGQQFTYGARIVLHPIATEEQKNELFKLASPDAQWTQEDDIEIRTENHQTSGALLVIDKGSFVHLEDTSGAPVVLPHDGLAVSRKTAEDLGMVLNDKIQFKYRGADTYLTAVVKEIVTPPAPQGVYMSKTYWETLSQTFTPNTLLAKTENIADKALNYGYVKEVAKLEQQLADANDVLNSIMMVVIMLLGAAILLSVIIQYNMGILSFTERSREYATLKVVGYKKNEIKSIIRKRNQLQVIMGLILGVPIGYQFLRVYVPIISTRTLEFSSYLKPQSLIISLLIVIICSYVVTSVVVKKSGNLDMVTALKSVE